MKYGFGIDVGGTTIKIGYFDTTGSLLESWSFDTDISDNGCHILTDINNSLNNFITENNIDRATIIGIGIGIPGPVERNGVVRRCVNLGWDVFNIEETFSRITGFRTKAANDANMAALGEMWKGGGEGYQNLVMVTLGTGIGGGIIIDKSILSGCHGAAGEFGHMPIKRDEQRKCGCGKTNCLEVYASGIALAKTAQQRTALYDGETMLKLFSPITAKDIFDCAKSGDALSIELVEDFGSLLGEAFANIACVCDPEVFVLGGGVSHAGQPLIDVISKHYKIHCFHACSDTRFELATLGGNAGMYGAMRILL